MAAQKEHEGFDQHEKNKRQYENAHESKKKIERIPCKYMFHGVMLHSKNVYYLFSNDDNEKNDEDVDENVYPLLKITCGEHISELTGDKDTDEDEDKKHLQISVTGDEEGDKNPCCHDKGDLLRH
jgi:hypothetical protein